LKVGGEILRGARQGKRETAQPKYGQLFHNLRIPAHIMVQVFCSRNVIKVTLVRHWARERGLPPAAVPPPLRGSSNLLLLSQDSVRYGGLHPGLFSLLPPGAAAWFVGAREQGKFRR
ncbi:MAG: hypothetical protein ABSD13_20455, partial [Candidatus Korobacteraceae bacterium]